MGFLQESVFSKVRVPVALVDDDGRFLEVNPYFLKNLVRSRERVEGRRLFDVLRMDPGGGFFSLDVQDPSLVPCRLAGNVPDESVHGWVLILPLHMGDLSLRLLLFLIGAGKKAPFPVQQDFHEARLAALGRLSAGIIHEISNPLSVINGCAQLLEATSGLTREVMDTVHRIRSEAQRTSELVRRVLPFARRNRDVKERFAIHEVVEEAASIMKYGLKNRNIQLLCGSPPRPPLRVEGFRNRLIQVVLNLIHNAEQAIAESGGTGTISIELNELNGGIVIDIRDSGPGISPDDKDRIFDAFFTTKDRDQGTGMGLYLARKILHDHGGDLRLHLGDPGNTTFRISLPMYEEPEEERKIEAGGAS